MLVSMPTRKTLQCTLAFRTQREVNHASVLLTCLAHEEPQFFASGCEGDNALRWPAVATLIRTFITGGVILPHNKIGEPLQWSGWFSCTCDLLCAVLMGTPRRSGPNATSNTITIATVPTTVAIAVP